MDNLQLSTVYMGSYIIALITSSAFLLLWRIFPRPLNTQQRSVTSLAIAATAWTAVEFTSVFFYFGNSITLILNRLSMAIAILMFSALLDFSLRYRGEIKRKTFYLFTRGLRTTAAILALVTPYSVDSITLSQQGFPIPVLGTFSSLFLLVAFIPLMGSVYIFFSIWKDKERSPLVRRSSLILLFGGLIPGLLGLVTNIVLPLLSIEFLPVAHIFSLITQGSYIYVIITGGLGIRSQDVTITDKVYYFINLAVSIALFVGFFIFYTLSSQNLVSAINTQMENYNETKSEKIQTEVDDILTDMQILSHVPLIVNFVKDPESQADNTEIILGIEKLLGDFGSAEGLYDNFLIGLDGEIWWSQTKESDYKTNLITGTYAETILGETFRETTSLLKPSISGYEYYDPSREEAAFVTMPITQDGIMYGVLAVQLQWDQFTDIIEEEETITYATHSHLFEEPGVEISAKAQQQNIPEEARDECSNYTIPKQISFVSHLGERSIGYISKSPVTGWCLLSAAHYEDAYKPQNTLLQSFALVSILLSAAIAVLAHRFGETISDPIKQLQESVTTIGEARFEKKVAMDRKDEVGQLSLVFDQMTQRLKESRLEIHRKVAEQTKAISTQTRKLEDQQRAIMNILEDVEIEKEHVSQERDKLQIILQSIGDGVFVIDINRKITLFNKMASEISGYSEKEATGKNYKEVLKFISEETGQLSEAFVEDAILKGQSQKMENHTLLERQDGEKVPVADSSSPIKNSKGDVVGCVVVFRDVSVERELEEMKTEFLSVAAHQLRTPLGSMRWNMEMLLDGDLGELSELVRQTIEQTYESNQRMVTLVNDLLNVSRIDQERVADKPEPTDIVQIVKQAVTEQTQSAEQLNVKIELTMKDMEDKKIVLDGKKFTEVISNLLSNAIKYNKPGGTASIDLGFDSEGYHTNTGKSFPYMIKVADTGIGIPEADQKKLFSKFFRAGNAVKSETEGSGLGLFVVKSYIEDWGGEVEFESKEGEGTTFTLYLPSEAQISDLSRVLERDTNKLNKK